MATFSLYVMRAGESVWQTQSRIDSSPGVPLAEEGQQHVDKIARQLDQLPIAAVYSCEAQADHESARRAGRTLGAKVRTHEDLRELDYGLWQGLTEEEVARRHPKLYRQWKEAPQTFRPPQGETLAEADSRLRWALREIARKHKNKRVLLVLRPVMLGLLRCIAEEHDTGQLWRHVDPGFTWGCYEVDVDSL
jgi:broad specificity phosphatase PhoE